MMNFNRKAAVMALFIATACLGACQRDSRTTTPVSLSATTAPTTNSQSANEWELSDEEIKAHEAGTRQRVMDGQAGMAIRHRLAENGMEPTAAGFHLLQPFPDPHHGSNYQGGAPSSYGGFRYWVVDAVSEQYEYREDGFYDDIVNVSYLRCFANGTVTYSVKPDFPGASTYSVIGEFSAVAIARLRSLYDVESDPLSEWTDWYGISRQSNEAATSLKVAAVASGIVYKPIDLGGILLNPGGPVSVTIAEGMQLNDAHDLDGRLRTP